MTLHATHCSTQALQPQVGYLSGQRRHLCRQVTSKSKLCCLSDLCDMLMSEAGTRNLPASWHAYVTDPCLCQHSSCDYPVIDYGRLWPCLHAFCMGCVSDMDSCRL
jgi:hypothetical protein